MTFYLLPDFQQTNNKKQFWVKVMQILAASHEFNFTSNTSVACYTSVLR